ncbi:MAG: DUF2470 domain-containing protein [Burkholderiales bacterium]
MSIATNARRYLRAHSSGVLATISQKHEGYPFGSVATYVTDHAAQPVLLLSALAEHTKNIATDSRVSLLVQDRAADVQAAARLTLVGDAAPIETDAAFVERFRRLHAGADQLLALGDFRFFKIVPRALRYIEGFCGIHWVSAEAFAPPPNRIAEIEEEIIDHMNTDHHAALADYARAVHHAGAPVRLVAIDCDGIDIVAGDATLRIDFETSVTNAGEVRTALTALARRSRESS